MVYLQDINLHELNKLVTESANYKSSKTLEKIQKRLIKLGFMFSMVFSNVPNLFF